ncbi:MAG: SUMF1/EgtB/PvdO family nonheme iron enzyme [Acidobacteria bacterium]|nr:SUMF1/EgtB/PvdO family nonheme iron enzyme [Acidobacteriota bacterium]
MIFRLISRNLGGLLGSLCLAHSVFAQSADKEFVRFPETTFAMERPGQAPGASARSIEQEITLAGFMIGATEVAQQSFEEVMGYNPSAAKGPQLPVTNMSWVEAIEYCNRRSKREKFEPCYNLETYQCDVRKNGYRLPTEAEWTFAARSSVIPRDRPELANLGSDNTKSIERLRSDLRERTVRAVGSYPPDDHGLYEMLGNVWEWTHDYFNTHSALLTKTEFPLGPGRGLERVLMGGSFRSGFWGRGSKAVAARDFRTGRPQDAKSKYTGFRLCRTIPAANFRSLTRAGREEWLAQFNQVPAEYRGKLGELSPVVPPDVDTVEEWKTVRQAIRAKWRRVLGSPSIDSPPEPLARLVRTDEEDFYTGKLMYLRTEKDSWEKIYLMRPKAPVRTPTPVVIVPYYDVDTPIGRNLGGRLYTASHVRQFGLHMARRGYVVLAVRWFGESYGEDYAEAVASLYERHPNWSGLGKWVWDSQRVLDYIATLPDVDTGNIGMIGHSLGGKMTLYATAMDQRITAAVSSEPGIGLSFSNYEDYWYLSDAIQKREEPYDHHELLGLIAPRPYLLIGGDSADSDRSWYYINAARSVYQLFQRPQDIGYYNHRQGHSPSPEALELALEWLEHALTRK